jgi:hypothetical protein
VPEIDDDDGLEQTAVEMLGGGDAGEESSASPNHQEVPRCPTCGRATDDVADMDEQALLQNMRKQRDGTIVHQEQNIAKTLILANLPRVPDKPTQRAPIVDENLPAQGHSALPIEREETASESQFDLDTYKDTEGG